VWRVIDVSLPPNAYFRYIKSPDKEVIKSLFPYQITRESYDRVEPEIGDYFVSLGEDALVIEQYRRGPNINFGPYVIVYGFKHEQDAVAFKLKFGGI
jgi:hypothetical protein